MINGITFFFAGNHWLALYESPRTTVLAKNLVLLKKIIVTVCVCCFIGGISTVTGLCEQHRDHTKLKSVCSEQMLRRRAVVLMLRRRWIIRWMCCWETGTEQQTCCLASIRWTARCWCGTSTGWTSTSPACSDRRR